MCFLKSKVIYTEQNKIPNEVIFNILMIAKNYKTVPKELPNNLIADINGTHWTTWDDVIKIANKGV